MRISLILFVFRFFGVFFSAFRYAKSPSVNNPNWYCLLSSETDRHVTKIIISFIFSCLDVVGEHPRGSLHGYLTDLILIHNIIF